MEFEMLFVFILPLFAIGILSGVLAYLLKTYFVKKKILKEIETKRLKEEEAERLKQEEIESQDFEDEDDEDTVD